MCCDKIFKGGSSTELTKFLGSIERSSWSTVELSDSNSRGNRVVETESNIKDLKECWVPRNQNELIHAISKGIYPPPKDKTLTKNI